MAYGPARELDEVEVEVEAGMVAVEERVVLLVLLQVGGRAQVSQAAPTVVREGVPLRTVADLKDEGRGGPGTVEAGVGEAG